MKRNTIRKSGKFEPQIMQIIIRKFLRLYYVMALLIRESFLTLMIAEEQVEMGMHLSLQMH